MLKFAKARKEFSQPRLASELRTAALSRLKGIDLRNRL